MSSACVQEYPALAKKYGVLFEKGDTDSIRTMLTQATPQLLRLPKVSALLVLQCGAAV